MLESLLVYVQQLIQAHGVLGVFFATLIEEIIAPIPSALVPLLAGFVIIPEGVSTSVASLEALTLIAPAVALGIGLGSSFVYALAYWGGKPAIDRYGKLLGTSWTQVQAMEARIAGGWGDEAALFGLRLIPIIPGVALSALFGVLRYPFKRFILITMAASYVRAAVLAYIGWQAGEFYYEYLDRLKGFEHLMLIFIAIIAVGALIWYFSRRSKTGS